MCGIVGVFLKDGEETPKSRWLWEMIEPIKNRGPDGQHIWLSKGVGFGHARLCILDLDARSDQPMVDPATGCVITFNGEIYNYIELRDELVSHGYVFETSGDTEVILKAYEHWGTDCLNRFNGMWAFALYDPRTETLFCARDRFGVKPFVYGLAEGSLVFASEAKAILAVYPQLGTPNAAFLRHFIEVGDFAGSESTFYQGLKNLLPGHFFVTTHGSLPKPKRYWHFKPRPLSPLPSEEEVLNGFKALLVDAIRLRFRSDVPVGACLSGGLDSSSIVGIASKLFNTSLSTFSCIYPDFPQVDESRYIQKTTEKFGCQAHWTSPTHTNLLEAMIQSIHEQDGPTGTPAVLSQRAVMALAHGKVTVLLDGQGGDEVLGGYHSYFPYSLQGLLRQFFRAPSPGSFWKFWSARQAIEKRTGTRFLPKFHHLRKKAKKRVEFSRPRFGLTALDDLQPPYQDDLSAKMMEDLLLTMPNLLHYEDRNSMAFSLESRLPFLDYRLVEYMFSLPPTFKINQERTKVLLYETVEGLLPEEIVHRKDKMGFATPGQHWFRDPGAQASLTRYTQVFPSMLSTLPDPVKEGIRTSWEACRQGTPISAREESTLWRFFTSCLWLDLQVQKRAVSPAESPALLHRR